MQMNRGTTLPSGTVSFLFTDIEGSTKLWEAHPEAMRLALARHDAILRTAIESHGGHIFKTTGDAFCAAFATAPDALETALAAQRALRAEEWGEVPPLRVRVALHTGAAEQRDGDYFGPPLNRVSRLLEAAHGGQMLISQTTADLARDSLPASAGLRDLGVHRLKDLARPEHIFQFLHPDLPAEFPPLHSLDALPNNLPLQVTSFIGREREIEEVKQLLAKTRLLTLTGSGGTGKTRLALQVAAELLPGYAEGVWLAELAPLADPAFVPQTVAAALVVKEQPGTPLTQTLVEALKPRTLLLLLDNCEHLLGACATLAEALLRHCPGVRLLATSREGLNIPGEAPYRLRSLAAPDPREWLRVEGQGSMGTTDSATLDSRPLTLDPRPSTLLQYEAVQLFLDRARTVAPSFAVTTQNAPAVAAVCHRLDGIPLAIELAAARVKALPVEKLNERLADMFRLLTGGSRTALPRQQTLRALIDWSYDLLSEPEQALLRRLSVFVGGWTLEAAEAVCGEEGVGPWALGVGTDEPAPTAQGLTPNAQRLTPDEVLDLLTSLVEKSLVLYEEREGEGRYRLLETVRQYARDRLLEAGEAAEARRRHLDFFFGLAREAALGPTAPERERAFTRAGLKEEHDNLRAALEWSKTERNGAEIGLRLIDALWWPWYVHGCLREGREYLMYFLSREEVAGDTLERAHSLNGAGFLADKQGDWAAARSLLEQSLEMYRKLGRDELTGGVLNNLGEVASNVGDDTSAHRFYEECLAVRRKREDKWGIGWALIHLGRLARLAGEYERAASLDQESLSLFREVANGGGIRWALLELGNLSRAQEDCSAAHSFYQEGLRILGPESPEPPRYLEAVAALAVAQGQGERAARLYGVAEALRKARGTPLPPCELDAYHDDVAVARAALGEEAFAAAWAEGRAMTVEQAIAYALDEPV
jgi:predicted ATPase/class 3 adenylate cyclase